MPKCFDWHRNVVAIDRVESLDYFRIYCAREIKPFIDILNKYYFNGF